MLFRSIARDGTRHHVAFDLEPRSLIGNILLGKLIHGKKVHGGLADTGIDQITDRHNDQYGANDEFDFILSHSQPFPLRWS